MGVHALLPLIKINRFCSGEYSRAPTIDSKLGRPKESAMIDIDEMLDWKNVHSRSIVTEETMQRKVDEGIVAIEHLLEQQLKLCAVSAVTACDKSHSYRHEAIQDAELPSPEYSSRVRLRGNSLLCVWYSNVYRQEGKNPLSKEVKKGAGFKYLKSGFHKASESEMQAIDEVESQYVKVRIAAAKLRKLRAALAEYKRSVTTICINDYEEPVKGE